jgi:hypothetical protein
MVNFIVDIYCRNNVLIKATIEQQQPTLSKWWRDRPCEATATGSLPVRFRFEAKAARRKQRRRTRTVRQGVSDEVNTGIRPKAKRKRAPGANSCRDNGTDKVGGMHKEGWNTFGV